MTSSNQMSCLEEVFQTPLMRPINREGSGQGSRQSDQMKSKTSSMRFQISKTSGTTDPRLLCLRRIIVSDTHFLMRQAIRMSRSGGSCESQMRILVRSLVWRLAVTDDFINSRVQQKVRTGNLLFSRSFSLSNGTQTICFEQRMFFSSIMIEWYFSQIMKHSVLRKSLTR